MHEHTETPANKVDPSQVAPSRSLLSILQGLSRSGKPVTLELAATQVGDTAIQVVARTQDGQEQGRYEVTATGIKALPCA